MARKGKCSCTPKRRGPLTVKVSRYYRTDGTKVKAHRRHTPK